MTDSVSHQNERTEVASHGAILRPFFLCAGVAAVAVMVVWLLGFTKRNPLLTYYGSSGWHAHEMLFGYMMAVMAGFLLAPLRDRLRAPVLVGLVLLWLVGRALPLMSNIPPWGVAIGDFAFLPSLILVLVKSSNQPQVGLRSVVALLTVMTVANALVHSEWLGYTNDTAPLGEVLAIYGLILLMTLMAGQVLTSCITPASVGVVVEQRPVIETASIAMVIILALADLFSPFIQVVEVCALLAAAVHAWRWLTWAAKANWSQPLHWALLAGYAWLIVGFVLIAVSYSDHLSHMLAFHAFMVGGFGGLSLGMMAMIQGGNASRLPPMAMLAFVILNVAAVLRIVGPLSSFHYSQALITAAGALWIVSFILFLLVYAPGFMQGRLSGYRG